MKHRSAPLALLFATLFAASPAFASKPVNINTAEASVLADSLDGVGLAKAQAIIAWREANGAFASADQLTEVKGIGPSLVERNRDAIQLGDEAKPAKQAKPATKTKATRAGKPRVTDAED